MATSAALLKAKNARANPYYLDAESTMKRFLKNFTTDASSVVCPDGLLVCEVVVSYTTRPSSVYVWVRQNLECVNQIHNSLTFLMQDGIGNIAMPPTTVEECQPGGCMVVRRKSYDGKRLLWDRALVKEQIASDCHDGVLVKLLLVDSGEPVTLPIKAVYPCPKEFCIIPPVAQECCLQDAPSDIDWTVESTQKLFSDLCYDSQDLKATISNVQQSPVPITLFDRQRYSNVIDTLRKTLEHRAIWSS